jgi:hypothetical protein
MITCPSGTNAPFPHSRENGSLFLTISLVDELEPGVWIIKLGQFIPDSERWLYEAQVQQEVAEAIAWAECNPPRSQVA